MSRVKWDGDSSGAVAAQEAMTKAAKKFKDEAKEGTNASKALDAAARRIAENVNPQEKYNRKLAEAKAHYDAGRLSAQNLALATKKYGDELDRAGNAGKKAFNADSIGSVFKMGMGVMGITDALSMAVQGFKEFDAERKRAADNAMRARMGIGQLSQLAASDKNPQQAFKDLVAESDAALGAGAASDRNEAANLVFDLAAAGLNRTDRNFAVNMRATGSLTNVGGLAQAYDAIRTAMGEKEVGSFEQFTGKALAAGAASPGTVEQLPVALSRAGSSARALGLSDESLLAAGAILAKEAGSPSEGGTKMAALLSGIQRSGVDVAGMNFTQMIERLSTEKTGFGGVFKDNDQAISAFRTMQANINPVKDLERNIFASQVQGLAKTAVGLPNLDESQSAANSNAQEKGRAEVINQSLGTVEQLREAAITNFSNNLRTTAPGIRTEIDIFFEKMAAAIPFMGDPRNRLVETQNGLAPIVGNDALNEKIVAHLQRGVEVQEEILRETKERNGKVRSAKAANTSGRPARP